MKLERSIIAALVMGLTFSACGKDKDSSGGGDGDGDGDGDVGDGDGDVGDGDGDGTGGAGDGDGDGTGGAGDGDGDGTGGAGDGDGDGTGGAMGGGGSTSCDPGDSSAIDTDRDGTADICDDTPCEPTINLLNGTNSGGDAVVVAIDATGDTSPYRDTFDNDCSDSWYPQGTLCDEGPYRDNPFYSYKSNYESGATWGSLDEQTDLGRLVIDLGSETEFDELRVFQMYSDGKTTHIEFFVHAETGNTNPPIDDSGWVSVTDGMEPVDEGMVNDDWDIVTHPTVFPVTPTSTRYLLVVVENDGSQGDGSYIELRSVKMYNKRCAVSCADAAESGKASGDGIYASDQGFGGMGGGMSQLDCTF